MCTLVGAKRRFSSDLNQAFTKLSHPARYNEAINPEFLVGGNVPLGAFAVIARRAADSVGWRARRTFGFAFAVITRGRTPGKLHIFLDS